MDDVIGVDHSHRCVRLASGATLTYDMLVLATGARHSYFGNDGWEAHAPGIKTIDDALEVRTRILSAMEPPKQRGRKMLGVATTISPSSSSAGLRARLLSSTQVSHSPKFYERSESSGMMATKPHSADNHE